MECVMKGQSVIIALAFTFPILIIAFMQIYSRIKKGRLTAQAPFLFLKDNDRNKLMTTLVFGFLSQTIFDLIMNKQNLNFCGNVELLEQGICEFFELILYATLAGLLAYPLFALITSPHVLVASIAGILYVTWELIRTGLIFNLNECTLRDEKISKLSIALTPSFIFLAILLLGFAYRVYMCVKTGFYDLPSHEKSVVLSYQTSHVQELLKRPRSLQRRQSFVERVKNLFKPWYKFPPAIFHSLVIVCVFIYTVSTSNMVATLTSSISLSTNTSARTLLIFIIVITVITYASNILHFLFCIQRDTFSVYSGDHKLFERTDKQHNLALFHHIAFPAYLVSAMIIGFALCFVAVRIVIFCIYLFTKLPELVWLFIRFIISFAGVGLGFNFLQRLVIRYCLTDRDSSKLAINLKHVRIYYVLAFFMFFVNIVRSGLSFVKRLLFTVLNLLLFFGRLDRNPMMFFKRMDISATYGSFLRVENVFKNPTMRLFCQILKEPRVTHVSQLTTQDSLRDIWGNVTTPHRGDLYSKDGDGLDNYNRSKDSKRCRNRWHLAYTLLNNPTLKKLRNFQKLKIDAGSDAFIV